jgi:hypothetical protein
VAGKLRKLLSADELFESSGPAPRLSQLFDRTLGRFLQDDSHRRSQRVECHQWACHWVVVHARDDSSWVRQAQTDPDLHKLARLWYFQPQRPVIDPISHETLVETPVFFAVTSPPGAASEPE